MEIRYCGAGTISQSAEAPGGGMHPSCYEILYITGGKVKFKWRGNVCEAEAPAVFILPNSTPHELESLAAEAKFRFLELEDPEEFPFSNEQVDDWNFMQARKDIYSKIVLASSVIQSLDFVYHLQSTGLAEQDSNLGEVCLLEIRKTYKLIAHILGASGGGNVAVDRKIKHKSRAAVDLLIDYLDWRYKENVTLETLAEIVALDPSYLVRLFKKHMNMTPFEYLRDLRLRAAASYLSGSDMPISSIVQETGFNSVHHFTRLFKSHYGQSPAEWRKQLKSQELMA
ncbi:helix-turn-helix domain-containing protein [Cohnella herbarum]|uniref:Helix-turn-helix transcriptional regulator n=1 Tax=Cohnella herbarum TaxID=2728023 RepID=A0A7Z2VN78_9BACL|nr:AraC family transcriptional regulator [Cohnella herbarum]QJD86172.1 helix-turn-helix transcriptional regulator [Cohnella herbarum]